MAERLSTRATTAEQETRDRLVFVTAVGGRVPPRSGPPPPPRRPRQASQRWCVASRSRCRVRPSAAVNAVHPAYLFVRRGVLSFVSRGPFLEEARGDDSHCAAWLARGRRPKSVETRRSLTHSACGISSSSHSRDYCAGSGKGGAPAAGRDEAEALRRVSGVSGAGVRQLSVRPHCFLEKITPLARRSYCLDMKKRGGSGTLRRPCEMRGCVATSSGEVREAVPYVLLVLSCLVARVSA